MSPSHFWSSLALRHQKNTPNSSRYDFIRNNKAIHSRSNNTGCYLGRMWPWYCSFRFANLHQWNDHQTLEIGFLVVLDYLRESEHLLNQRLTIIRGTLMQRIRYSLWSQQCSYQSLLDSASENTLQLFLPTPLKTLPRTSSINGYLPPLLLSPFPLASWQSLLSFCRLRDRLSMAYANWSFGSSLPATLLSTSLFFLSFGLNAHLRRRYGIILFQVTALAASGISCMGIFKGVRNTNMHFRNQALFCWHIT